MKTILEQVIKPNHFSHAEHFPDSVRNHPSFQYRLDLRGKPTIISTNKGELLLISEYVSGAMDRLVLSIIYVHKYIDNSWVEILAVPLAKKVRVHGDYIYVIKEMEQGRYSVSQCNLDGHQIQGCLIENEPDTQINLDSIYFTENRIVYCYQCFIEKLSYVNREKYYSSYRLEWVENTEKNLLSVKGYSLYDNEQTCLWSKSFNTCWIKVKCKEMDGCTVYDKDLGLKSFHQIVTMLDNDVMQICYTDWDIPQVMREDEYLYHVCYIYGDGTINDHAQSIGLVKRNPFEKQFSQINQLSIFFSGITMDKTLCTYRIDKNCVPELVYSAPKPTTKELDSYVSQEKQEAYAVIYAKIKEDEEEAKKEHAKYEKLLADTDPLTPKQRRAEDKAYQRYLEDTKDDEPRESLDIIFSNLDDTSDMIWRQRYEGMGVFGVAYNKLFYSMITLDYPGTVSLCGYYDIEKKEKVFLEADKLWRSYFLGNVTEEYFLYFSGSDAQGFGYRSGTLIIKKFSGEVVCTVQLDYTKLCIGFIEQMGVLYIFYADRADPLKGIHSADMTCHSICFSDSICDDDKQAT